MIAALFPGNDGQFDYRIMLAALFLILIGVAVLFWTLPVAIRRGKIQSTARGSRNFLERSKDPISYWCACAFYFVGALAMAGFGIALMFGWQRHWH